MKKLTLISLMLGVMMIVSVMGMVSAVIPTTLFSNGFESGNFNGWSQHDNDWVITTSGEHSGTYAALTCDSDNDVLRKTISTSGYENIVFSYWYKISESLGADDHVYAEWYDGSNWHEVAHYTNVNSGNWILASFNLPSGAKNNPNFQIRFRSVSLESCCEDALKLDDVLVTGNVIFQQTPVCGNGIIEADEQCDDGNTQNGDGCSATCQIEDCVLTVDKPVVGQWFDSQAVPIEWHLSNGCQSVVYFHLYYHKSLDGNCNPQGPWNPIVTNLPSGTAANPSFPNYNYTWNKPSESGQYCVYVEVHSSGKKGYSGIFNVDLAKPEVSLSVGTPKVGDCAEETSGDCYVNQNTPMTLTCADNNPIAPWQSGVNKIEYRYQVGTGAFTEWKTYDGSFKFPQDSNHLLQYRCYDKVGKVDTEEKNLIVDTVAPKLTKTVGEPKVKASGEYDWYVTTNTEICLSATDPEPHPVGGVVIDCRYAYWTSNPSGEPTGKKPIKLDDGCFTYGEDSWHELSCTATDALGNSETLTEKDIVDTLAPLTKVSYGGPYYENKGVQYIDGISTVVLTAEDPQPHPVGVDKTYYRQSVVADSHCYGQQVKELVSLGDAPFMEYLAPFKLEESCHLIEYYSVDKLGNKEVVKQEFVFVDKTAPVLHKEVGKPSHECTSSDKKSGFCEKNWDWIVTMDTPIKLSCEDQTPHPSGVKELCYRILWDGEIQLPKGIQETSDKDGWVCVPRGQWIDEKVTVYFTGECEHTLEFYCVDNVGKTSATDSEIFKVEGTKFPIPLEKKWNLISVPFNLISTDIEEVFKDISGKIEGVWSYEDGTWRVYSPSGPSSLNDIVPGKGYWVKTTEDTSLLVGGSLMSPGPVVPSSVELDKGWNLIGRYGLVPNQPAYCALFSLVDTQEGFPRWSALWGYNSASQSFVPFSEFSLTNPGEGYWVEMDVKDNYSPSSVCYGFHPLDTI